MVLVAKSSWKPQNKSNKGQEELIKKKKGGES